MNCTLCDGQLTLCATCRSVSCTTSLCSRCAAAQPDAHTAVAAASRPLVSLGDPVPVLMDW